MRKHVLSAAVAGLLFAANAQAANIVIVVGDAAGVGFNDPTPVVPVGDNPGVTLGAQRLNVFQAAANQWGAVLNSPVDIRILATFEGLTCSGTSAVLGSAGAMGVFRTFTNNPGAPYDETWFSSAEANALAGSDLDGATDDIRARFNVSIDSGTCLNGVTGWWYDTNGANPIPNDRIALMPVVFHEIAHGLGFQTYTNTATGEFLGTSSNPNTRRPSIFDHFLMDRNFDADGETWVDLGDGQGGGPGNSERAASAIDDPYLVWSGADVTAKASGYLDPPSVAIINSPGGIAGSYEAQSATFGPIVPLSGVSGNVVEAQDGVGTSTDACEPISNPGAVAGNIALIDRGTCTFTTKVANAQAAGAIGVLIANNAATGLPGMGGADGSIIIPSYGVTQALGASIRANLPVDATLGYDFANLAGMNGGYLRMFAPNPRQPGSSVSHFSTVASPNLLMEPSLNQELFSETDLTVPLFRDIFWPVNEAAIANKAPYVSAASEFLVDVNTPTPLSEMLFGDIDAGTADIEVGFSVTKGVITLNPSAGVVTNGSGTAAADITGSRATLLSYVTQGNVLYTTALNDLTDTPLSIYVDDLGNSGTGGPLTDAANATIVVNSEPVAADDGPYVTDEDPAGPLTTGNVLSNDSLGDLPTTITAFDAASANGGTVSDNGDGTFDYTPVADFNGSDSFTYTITDVDGDDDTATVSITVNAVNDAPSFTKGADQSVVEGSGAQSVTGWATAISAGPADEASQALTFNVTGNTNAALFSAGPSIAANGDLSYTPAAGTSGTADITITLSDDGGTANSGVDTSASQVFTITVTPINHVPSFTKGGDQTVDEDAGAQSVTGWATAISDGDGDTQNLTFNVTGNTNAVLFAAGPSIAANGDLSYTPADDANGSATITIELMDDGGTAGGGVDTSATQDFVITVNSVNDAPSFTKGADQSVVEGSGAQSVTGWATAISAGPADEAGQALTFNVTGNTSPALFAAGPAIAANGDLSYTPTAGTSGTADITITLSDDGGTANSGVDTSASQVFTITVTPINHVPSFTKGGDQTVDEDAGAQSVTGWATAISDGDGETQNLTFNVTGNTNAALFAAGPSIAANGDLSYTPADDANGSATITIELMDDGGTAGGGVDTSATQDFVITVNAVNDVPVANDDGYGVNEGATLSGSTVKANDTDVEDGTPAGDASLVSGPSNASSFTLNPDGTFSYTHDGSETTTDSFTYTVQDADGADSNVATVTITITPVDDGPAVANDDGATVLQNSTGNVIDVLANDVADPDDGSLAVTAVGAASNGTTSFTAGDVSYTPTSGYCGADSFTYEVNGGAGSATVDVSVTCLDPAIFADGFED